MLQFTMQNIWIRTQISEFRKKKTQILILVQVLIIFFRFQGVHLAGFNFLTKYCHKYTESFDLFQYERTFLLSVIISDFSYYFTASITIGS